MTGLQIALVVLGGLALFVVMFVLLPRLVLASLREGLTARIKAHCREDEVVMSDLGANSFGQESRGRFQLRGNGALVLTREAILFLQAVTERDLTIPLDRVTETSFVRSHLGKATLFRLVKIHFDLGEGPDSIAVFVRKPDDFRAKIDELRARPGVRSPSSPS